MMPTSLIFLFIFSVQHVFVSPLPNGSVDEVTRLVAASPAENGSVPYQVSLRSANGLRLLCGASIITPKVLLTAAHCVHDINDTSTMTAYVGTNQLNSGGIRYNIRKIVYHKDFDKGYIDNDIGILFTEEAIVFGDGVEAVELDAGPVAEGEDLIITGWGLSSFPNGDYPNDLMKVAVKAVSYEKCKAAHKDPVYESQICTFSKNGGGTCYGDSGGPVVLKSTGRQVSIVSWGPPCATGVPDVSTKVDAFFEWIVDTLMDDEEEHMEFFEEKRKQSRPHN